MHIREFNSGSFPCVAVCVFSCFRIGRFQEKPVPALGQIRRSALALLPGIYGWTPACSVHCVIFCTLDTVHCAPAAVAGQQQQKIQGGGKALRCQHSTSRSSLGKRVTATLEKQIDQKKKKLKAKEIKSRGVQSEQEGVPTSKQTCWLPGCICYISGTPPSDSSSGFLAEWPSQV